MPKRPIQYKDNVFGVRFLTARRNNRHSQNSLAVALDCSPSSIKEYESGRAMPRSTMLISICRELNVSSDWLLGLTDGVKRNVNGADAIDSSQRPRKKRSVRCK